MKNGSDLHISEIKKEYRRIDSAWLRLHYKMSVSLAVFACMVECFMAFIIIGSDMLSTSVGVYILKYILIPSGVNFLCVGLSSLVMRSRQFSQQQKIYTVSLVFMFICFILFAVHQAFATTYYLCAVAIILTTLYTDYRLTHLTSLIGIGGIVFAELLITWDSDKTSIFESTHRLGDFLISLFIMIGCFFVCLIKIAYEKEKNEASIRKEAERLELERRVRTDELTGVYSRKALHDAMRDLETGGEACPYIFAIADVDHFKEINDRFGHHAGDLYLVEFTNILKEYAETFDCFRYGGDEFCLLFDRMEMPRVIETCREIQKRAGEIRLRDYPHLKTTTSFGLAAYTGQISIARLFINADQALYEAKRVRNAIAAFGSDLIQCG